MKNAFNKVIGCGLPLWQELEEVLLDVEITLNDRPLSYVEDDVALPILRPVPNVVLLPCRTQMKLSFRFKHGSSTLFETIKCGTAELGSARLLSTASLAVPHGSSTTCFQTACYCRAELNS